MADLHKHGTEIRRAGAEVSIEDVDSSGIPRLPGLLPIPTIDYPDIGKALRATTGPSVPRIHLLIGPSDTGKSALLRALAGDYRMASNVVDFCDLSIVDWRDLISADRAEVVLIDHIDRINGPDYFSAAYDILDRVIPTIFAKQPLILMASIGTEWRDKFRHIYRLNPEILLQQSIPALKVSYHNIRPYTDLELEGLCGELGLDPHDFRDISLRRPGVLSMASATMNETRKLNGAQLREALTMRWIQAGNDPASRDARKALWKIIGYKILQDGVFSMSLGSLFSEFRAKFTTTLLADQAGGPIRWEEDRLQPDSPSWGDVAAANALVEMIRERAVESIRAPLRGDVIQAVIELSEEGTLATQVERKLTSLQGADFSSIGYLGPILGTLYAQVSKNTEINFSNLSLQGPDHTNLISIDRTVADVVEAALITSLKEHIPGLLAILEPIAHSTASAFRGGYECWESVRSWARNLPLRAVAEEAVVQLLPRDGSWRYEDILDVSVTGATTRLMTDYSEQFNAILQSSVSPVKEYLADIWDGINDGAWDQIDATSSAFISALNLQQASGKILVMEECGMQRARLGVQDVEHWRFIRCDLFLADFRSCRNLEKADLSGSNWWSAILPPPARYYLSRTCGDVRFMDWCVAPPWRNPYFSAEWPIPFN